MFFILTGKKLMGWEEGSGTCDTASLVPFAVEGQGLEHGSLDMVMCTPNQMCHQLNPQI